MSGDMGWIGMAREVTYYLSVVGADKDAEGRYLLVGEEGEGPVSFMGAGEELVVPGSVCYLVGGERKNLAAGLRGTSYGLGVTVF